MTNRFLATLSYILFFVFYSFAQQTVGVFKNTSQAFEGYTLIAPLDSKFTYLIDNCGRNIHSWESDYPPGASTYLLENGNLLRTLSIPNDFEFPGFGGGIELRSWDNELLWRYNYVSESYCLHHDVAYLPNPKISFFYHMFGFSIGTLISEISNDNGATWTNMWSISGQQQFSGFDPWLEATYDLSAFSGQTILHRFRTVAAGGYTGDMAVDDFSVINDGPIITEPEPVPSLGYWGLMLIALSLLTIVSVFLYRQ